MHLKPKNSKLSNYFANNGIIKFNSIPISIFLDILKKLFYI